MPGAAPEFDDGFAGWTPEEIASDDRGRHQRQARDLARDLIAAQTEIAALKAEAKRLNDKECDYWAENAKRWQAANEQIDAMQARAVEAERSLAEALQLAEERLAHANALQSDWDNEMAGRMRLRMIFGAREDETMAAFIERITGGGDMCPPAVHESSWQWRPTARDTAFAPPFGTVRACTSCGCLIAGGPTTCVHCVRESSASCE